MTKMKKLLVALTCCIVLVLALGITASAYGTTTIYSSNGQAEVPSDQVGAYLNVGWSLAPVKLNKVTPLPMNFTQYTYYTKTMSLDSFEVTGLYFDGNATLEMYYSMSTSGDNIDLQMQCLDGYGQVVATRNISMGEYEESYVSIPSSTVAFNIVAKNGSGVYEHRVQTDLYAMDGRHIWMYDMQVPIYESVGWYRATTLYAMDGRTIEVPPYQVASYQSVGWYTEADFYYNFIANNYYSFMGAGDYGSAMNILETYYVYAYDVYGYQLDEMFSIALKSEFNRLYNAGSYEGALDILEDKEWFLSGTVFEASVGEMRSKAMDRWRGILKCPLAVTGSEVYDGDYYDEAYIYFRNVSYKPIVAFKLNFTCYDIFGGVHDTYYDWYYCDDAYIPVGGEDYFVWELRGAGNNIDHIGNIKITEVVFEDRTKW